MVAPLSINGSHLLPKGVAFNRAVFMGTTGLTLTITISKNGAAFAGWAGAVTERTSGWYQLAMTGGDTDTEGDLAWHVDGGGANVDDFCDQVAAPVKLADGVAHGGTPGSSTATLALQQINVHAPSGVAFYIESEDNIALYCTGSMGANFSGANISGGIGLQLEGGTGGYALFGTGENGINMTASVGPVVQLQGGTTGPAVAILSGDPGVPGIEINGGSGSQDILLSGSGLFWNGVSSEPVTVTVAALPTVDANLVSIDGNPTNDNSAILKLQKLDIFNDGFGGPALRIAGYNSDDNSAPFRVENTNSGGGVLVLGYDGPAAQFGDGSSGAEALVLLAGTANTNASAIKAIGAGTGAAAQLGDGSVGAIGLLVMGGLGDGGNAVGMSVVGAGTGSGMSVQGGISGYGFDGTLSPTLLASYFIVDSGKVYADAVAGSVVKETATGVPVVGDVTLATLQPNYAPAIAGDAMTLTPAYSADVLISGTLPDQSTGDVNHIILPSGPAVNSVLTGTRLRILSGIAAGQERTIQGWNASALSANIDDPFFAGTPVLGDSFQVLYDHSYLLDGSQNVIAIATVDNFLQSALAQMFTLDSGETFATAVPGSVVAETADNATVGPVTLAAGSITDATFTTPSDGTGQVTGILSMILWLYERFFGKVVHDKTAKTIKTFQADGSTVRTTQAATTVANVDTVDRAT